MEGGNGLNPFEGLDPWGEETAVERRDAAGRTAAADDDGDGGEAETAAAVPPAVYSTRARNRVMRRVMGGRTREGGARGQGGGRGGGGAGGGVGGGGAGGGGELARADVRGAGVVEFPSLAGAPATVAAADAFDVEPERD